MKNPDSTSESAGTESIRPCEYFTAPNPACSMCERCGFLDDQHPKTRVLTYFDSDGEFIPRLRSHEEDLLALQRAIEQIERIMRT